MTNDQIKYVFQYILYYMSIPFSIITLLELPHDHYMLYLDQNFYKNNRYPN